MKVKNREGREIEIYVTAGGEPEDIEIYEAKYIDDNQDATDEEVEHILEDYQQEIFLEWEEANQGATDWIYDQMKDGG